MLALSSQVKPRGKARPLATSVTPAPPFCAAANKGTIAATRVAIRSGARLSTAHHCIENLHGLAIAEPMHRRTRASPDDALATVRRRSAWWACCDGRHLVAELPNAVENR